jgi:hypothetical protein
MSEPKQDDTIIRCSCWNVEVKLIGPPIACAACYCQDCDAGARQIEVLPNAAPVRDTDSATSCVLYRKDRVKCSNGAQVLQGRKIKEKSVTNRVVATCCNTAMFVDFDRGPHWVSVYRARLERDAPALQMRINTKFRRANNHLPNDVPSHPTFPLSLAAKLIASRIAMLLRQ